MSNEQTMLWLAILTTCDGPMGNDLGEDSGNSDDCREAALQMRDAGILLELTPHCYALTSKGHRLLMLVNAMCAFSLETD